MMLACDMAWMADDVSLRYAWADRCRNVVANGWLDNGSADGCVDGVTGGLTGKALELMGCAMV